MRRQRTAPVSPATIAVTVAALGALSFGLLAGPAQAKKHSLRWWVPANYTWKTLKDRFEKANPNYKVQIVDGELDKFYTMITAGLIPDVWGTFGAPGITADVTRGWVIDLGPYIKRDGKAMGIDDFFPGVMARFRVRGRQYSIPYFSYTDFYWYNTTMYDKAGLARPPLDASDRSWTWEAAVAAGQKMAVYGTDGKLRKAGLEFGRDPVSVTPTWFRMFNVVRYSDAALRSAIPQEVHLNTPEMKNALQHMWDLCYKQKIAGSPGPLSFYGGSAGSSIEAGWIVKMVLPVKTLKFRIAPLPWGETNSGTLWPDGWRISSQCKDPEAAWTLIKFLTSADSQRFVVTDPKGSYLGSPPTRKSIFYETLGRDIGKASGMSPDDVYKVHFQADAVGVVKESETISLDIDLGRFLDPVLLRLWQNRISPSQCAAELQSTADKMMPSLFKRWLRNTRYTGKE